MPRSRRRCRRRRTPTEIRELLARLEVSGLTQRAFAESESVPLSTLTWWRRRYGSAEGQEEGRLVPVHLAGDQAPVRDGWQRGAFEVALRSGHVIKVPADFSPTSLERLVGVLGRS